jgi:hypothetical protein
MRTTHLARQQVIVDAFAVEQLHELRDNVVELVKAARAAAEECEAADKYGEAVGQVDAEGIAESLRAALKPFER